MNDLMLEFGLYPLAKVNPCHNPAGSATGGQFCSTRGNYRGIPPESELSLVGSASHMGGSKAKELWQDTQGNQYMFKPTPEKEMFRAHIEEGVSRIAREVLPDVVDVRVATLNGKAGTLQRIVPADKDNPTLSASSLEKLSPKDIARLQGEHVVDWLTSQHDSHPKQFVRGVDGKLYGIDKSQAYKHIGNDKLSTSYHPNAAYGEKPPIYNTMGQLVQQGKLTLNPNDALPYIKKAQAIPDDKFVASLKPYATSLFKGDNAAQEAFYAKALARKQNLKADFEGYYSNVLGKPFKFEGSSVLTSKPGSPGKKEYVPPKEYKAGSAKAAIFGLLADGKPHSLAEVHQAASITNPKNPNQLLYYIKSDGAKLKQQGQPGWTVTQAGNYVKLTNYSAPGIATSMTAPRPKAPKTKGTAATGEMGLEKVSVQNYYKTGSVKDKVANHLADGHTHTLQSCLDIATETGYKYPKNAVYFIKADGQKTGAWSLNVAGKGSAATVRLTQTKPGLTTTTSTSKPLTTDKPATAFGAMSSSTLNSHSDVVWPSLSPQARTAVKDYSGSGYMQVNNVLRQDKFNPTAHPDSWTTKTIQGMDAASNAWKSPTDITVYRGLSSNIVKPEVGSVFVDKGFMSTSVSQSKAFSHGDALKILVPKGARAIPLGKNSNHPSEQELILPRNSKLVVVGVTPKTSNWGGSGNEITLRLLGED